jgi:hypothetical protein
MSKYTLSENDKNIYKNHYGVDVNYKNSNFSYKSKYQEQINTVSGIVERERFLTENYHKIPAELLKSKPGSVSSQLGNPKNTSSYSSETSECYDTKTSYDFF